MTNEKVKFLLNWNYFAEHICTCMTKLMTDSSYSDIIIATSDKRMIYSHRFVLANCSKYFQRLLKHMNKQKGIQLVVALPEIKYEIFKILMNYMYKGETQVPHELLPAVIKAGQFLEINGLVNLNEIEGTSNREVLSKLSPTGDSTCRSSYSHSPNSSSNHESTKVKISSTLRDKIHSKENTNNSSECVSHIKKKQRRRNTSEDLSPESKSPEENGKENRRKEIKSIKNINLIQEKKSFIQLPLKRKLSLGESIKKNSPSPSPSSSSESCLHKKQKKLSISQELLKNKVKDEKENSLSSKKKDGSVEELAEKVVVKVEVPDDVEEIIYNELQCDYCFEVYTNPSDWVKHMTEKHNDKGFQAYKDIDKSVGSSGVIRCVVCSHVCLSAAEWAKHLQTWHSEQELADANLVEDKPPVKKKRISNEMKEK